MDSGLTLSDLPVHMLSNILHRFSDGWDIVTLGQVTPTLFALSEDRQLWKKLCQYHFGEKQVSGACGPDGRAWSLQRVDWNHYGKACSPCGESPNFKNSPEQSSRTRAVSSCQGRAISLCCNWRPLSRWRVPSRLRGRRLLPAPCPPRMGPALGSGGCCVSPGYHCPSLPPPPCVVSRVQHRQLGVHDTHSSVRGQSRQPCPREAPGRARCHVSPQTQARRPEGSCTYPGESQVVGAVSRFPPESEGERLGTARPRGHHGCLLLGAWDS